MGNTNITQFQVREADFQDYLKKIRELQNDWEKIKFIPYIGDDDKNVSIKLKVSETNITLADNILPENIKESLSSSSLDIKDDSKFEVITLKPRDIDLLNLIKQITESFKNVDIEHLHHIKYEISLYRSIPLNGEELKQLLNFIVNNDPNKRIKEIVTLIRIILTKMNRKTTEKSILDKFKPMFIFMDLSALDVIQALINLSRIYRLMKDERTQLLD